MSCPNTHVLRIKRPSDKREWHNLATGAIETDTATIARLEAQLTDTDCKDCVIPANLKELCKRSFRFIYDNGFTPSSSTNDGGERPNFVVFRDSFTSLGWETGVGVVGAGELIGPYTSWTDQFNSTSPLGWVSFGVAYDPYGSSHDFERNPPPAWRAWSVAGCNPKAKYGSWKIQRSDGVIYEIFPVNYTESFEKIYTQDFVECDGTPYRKYFEKSGDEFKEVPEPSDIECYVDCNYPFEPVIIGESLCETKEYRVCNKDTNEQLIVFVNICEDGSQSTVAHLLSDYLSATSPDVPVYDLSGVELVDCSTGLEVLLPTPPCSDFVLTKLYRLNGMTGQLRNREWHDTEPAIGINASNTALGRGFRDRHDFSLPTTTDTLVTSLQLNDTNNTGSKLDVQTLEGKINVKKHTLARYAGGSEGYWAVELGKCCGPLEDLVENGGFFPTRNMPFELPKGIHDIRIWNIDSAGSNSSANLETSTDGGITWTRNNTPSDVELSNSIPDEECLTVKVCKDSGLMFDLLTGEELDPATLTTCPQMCEPCCGSSTELPQTLIAE